MAVNPTLEDILAAIQAQGTSAALYQEQSLDALAGIVGSLTLVETSLNLIAARLLPLATIDTNLSDVLSNTNLIQGDLLSIVGLIETLNSNGALNAQNAQIIQLSGIGACCDDIAIPGDKPTYLCAKSQSLIDRVFIAFNTLANTFTGPNLPTAEQIQYLFRFNQYGPFVPSYMTKSEAGQLLQGLQQRGFSGIENIGSLGNNFDLIETIRQIINDAPNADAAFNQLQSANFLSQGVPEPWNSFIRLGFTRTMFADLYSTDGFISGDGYDNEVCGPPGPPPPDWSATHNLLIDDSPVDSSTHSRILAPPSEGPPDGGRFGVRLTLNDEFYNGATVYRMPDLEVVGSLDNVDDEVTFELNSNDTGLRIEWGPAPEGENAYVEYLLVGYNPPPG